MRACVCACVCACLCAHTQNATFVYANRTYLISHTHRVCFTVFFCDCVIYMQKCFMWHNDFFCGSCAVYFSSGLDLNVSEATVRQDRERLVLCIRAVESLVLHSRRLSSSQKVCSMNGTALDLVIACSLICCQLSHIIQSFANLLLIVYIVMHLFTHSHSLDRVLLMLICDGHSLLTVCVLSSNRLTRNPSTSASAVFCAAAANGYRNV